MENHSASRALRSGFADWRMRFGASARAATSPAGERYKCGFLRFVLSLGLFGRLDIRKFYSGDFRIAKTLHVLAEHLNELFGVHLRKAFAGAVVFRHTGQTFPPNAQNLNHAQLLQFLAWL